MTRREKTDSYRKYDTNSHTKYGERQLNGLEQESKEEREYLDKGRVDKGREVVANGAETWSTHRQLHDSIMRYPFHKSLTLKVLHLCRFNV